MPPTKDGVIEPEAVAELVDMHTAMISVMHANNETGAVNDVAKIAALVERRIPRFTNGGREGLLLTLPR